MKLPNADKAVVEREKVSGYLLNPAHRFGASKVRFFMRFGFRKEAWEQLAQALAEHGQKHDVAKTQASVFGSRYEVSGRLDCPNGRRPRVRTVWQMDEGAVAPRLITAHPLEAE